MGEVAEMMAEGDLCAMCGCVLECANFNCPIYCDHCHDQLPPEEKKCFLREGDFK